MTIQSYDNLGIRQKEINYIIVFIIKTTRLLCGISSQQEAGYLGVLQGIEKWVISWCSKIKNKNPKTKHKPQLYHLGVYTNKTELK